MPTKPARQPVVTLMSENLGETGGGEPKERSVTQDGFVRFYTSPEKKGSEAIRLHIQSCPSYT